MSRDIRTATGPPIDTPLQVTLPTPEQIIQAKRPLVPPTQVPTVSREPPVAIDRLPEVVLQPTRFPSIEPERQEYTPTEGLGEQEVPQEPASDSPTEPELIGDPTGTLVAQPTQRDSLKVRLKIPAVPTRRSKRLRADTPPYYGPNGCAAYLASESALILSITPTSDEPKSIKDALNRSDAHKWTKAIDTELGTLQAKGTWIEVPEIPKGRKVISSKWFFKTKTNADGNVIKYKARLVVQGFCHG